jgi:hypothetical protein
MAMVDDNATPTQVADEIPSPAVATAAPVEPDPDEDIAALSRIQTLMFERVRIDKELRELNKRYGKLKNRECLRCGHKWSSYTIIPPNQCSLCHSLNWYRDPDTGDRRQRTPADPARPSWTPRRTDKPTVRVVEARAEDPEAVAYWARRARLTGSIPPPPKFGESNENQ